MKRWKDIAGTSIVVVGLLCAPAVHGQAAYAFINLKGELALNSDGHWTFLRPADTPGVQAGNSFYRGDKTGFYKVESSGDIVIYSQPGIFKTAGTTFYYFSRSMESPIYRLTKRNLRRFHQDPHLIRDFRHHHKEVLIPL
ncbi:MAG TPA: hypothetical protein VFE50_12290 [Cyclobacteriaceae bacterium]|nr:hypothetical protein [Cyclobacteriaceae bacterium]